MIRLDEVRRVELPWWDSCPYEKRHQGAGSLSPPREDIEKAAVYKPGRGPSPEHNHTSKLNEDFSPHTCEKVSFYCLSVSVYHILF